MKQWPQAIKTYFSSMTIRERIISILILVCLVAVTIAFVIAWQNRRPSLDYPPVVACDVMTRSHAQEILGDDILGGEQRDPVLARDVVTSKCSYSDMNPDKAQMRVAAIAVRTGINDRGIERNKTEFNAAKSTEGIKSVVAIGDSAFFDPERGQLNVLTGRTWMILSYGIGESPKSNSLAALTEIAHRLIDMPDLPTF